MRLLNTTTITFEEWEVTEVPPYTILSHVWGEEEVLYQDIIDKTAEKKKGYGKVFYTCQQASNDGYDWAWIDSCCINKTDGVELSEAINSMYKWYQSADVCYAYLIDVELLNPLALEPNPVWLGAAEARRKEPRWSFYEVNFTYSAWELDGDPVTEIAPRWQWTSASGSGNRARDAHDFLQEFSRSTWFTRGWTLQELIAPRQVVFYNKGWTEIGTRKSLKEHIAKVTGIEVSALLGGTQILRMLPAALKMSWASNRYTTKVEDIAYCLLGIFDITMPLLYGEGLTAMTRLQELIFLQTEDYSLFLCEKDYRDLHSTFALTPHSFHRNIQASVPQWAGLSGNRTRVIDFRNIYMHTSSLANFEPPSLSHARGMKVTIAKKIVTKDEKWTWDGANAVVWTYWCLRHESEEYLLCLDLNTKGTLREKYEIGHRLDTIALRNQGADDLSRPQQIDMQATATDTWSRAWYTPILVPRDYYNKFVEAKMFLRTRPIDQKRLGLSPDKYDPENTWALAGFHGRPLIWFLPHDP
ncbi:heterokaryon incompatibility protein-domain-containing protein [Microdochium trichocladiopsis]|uniref:Heterokaryon incompatibility protein-domain-containing protein n=1 Tax=Microdochium trichocladiopsis TaxID=1682393 RepID=A0A9P9BVS3_9PEZI|nr:heterokaryon incompatibility protein-domain-containing protein [Microdochium trichocladiopsis]KAH7040047.1 heterokaryon incompatibility protein-domain-containing protein [Microdochium trichocladiopsis]